MTDYELTAAEYQRNVDTLMERYDTLIKEKNAEIDRLLKDLHTALQTAMWFRDKTTQLLDALIQVMLQAHPK